MHEDIKQPTTPNESHKTGTPKQTKQDPTVHTQRKSKQLPSITTDVHTGVSQLRLKIKIYISEDRLVFHLIAHRI
jgi:hypothetical protein